MQSILGGCPGPVDRALQTPSRDGGEGVQGRKTPIFIGFYREYPPRQPLFFGGGEGQGANSIWRQPDHPQWTVTGMLTGRVARPESSKGVNVLAVAGTPFGVPQDVPPSKTSVTAPPGCQFDLAAT
jgi:hypothetical protein